MHTTLAIVAVEELSAKLDSVGAPLWEVLMVPSREPLVAPLRDVQRQSKQAMAQSKEVQE